MTHYLGDQIEFDVLSKGPLSGISVDSQKHWAYSITGLNNVVPHILLMAIVELHICTFQAGKASYKFL